MSFALAKWKTLLTTISIRLWTQPLQIGMYNYFKHLLILKVFEVFGSNDATKWQNIVAILIVTP